MYIYTHIYTCNTKTQHTQIVIARYNEGLAWMKQKPFAGTHAIIYNKGINNNFYHDPTVSQVVDLENIGRESHTYLYHIVNNYHKLADITIFLPGSSDHIYKIQQATKLMHDIEKYDSAVITDALLRPYGIKKYFYDFEIDKYTATDTDNLIINPESSLERSQIHPFGKWFEKHFRNLFVKYNVFSGILSIDKRDILQHPISYYQDFMRELTTPNPEVGHYLERSWLAVFHPLNQTLVIPAKSNNKKNKSLKKTNTHSKMKKKRKTQKRKRKIKVSH
jgi:hypothetical protein